MHLGINEWYSIVFDVSAVNRYQVSFAIDALIGLTSFQIIVFKFYLRKKYNDTMIRIIGERDVKIENGDFNVRLMREKAVIEN